MIPALLCLIMFSSPGSFVDLILLPVAITNLSFIFSPEASGRLRLSSESNASSFSRDEEPQARGEDEAGTPTEGAPFRARSKSAPPALWAAKKYGRQLRRMSDEFDSLLDKGVRTWDQRMDDGITKQTFMSL